MSLGKLGWIIAGILFLILLGGIFYLYNTSTNIIYYKQGVYEGQVEIITQITNTGTIPYFVTDEIGNKTIQTNSLQELCSKLK